MKFIKTFTLLLCLLSPFSQADTNLFGLILGKSTLHDVKKNYDLQDRKITPGLLNDWTYYSVSGKQFDEPQLQLANLFFDDYQKLGSILFIFSNSSQKYKELDAQLSRQYPRIKVPEIYPAGSFAYQNDTTNVLLTYSDNGILLTFTDLEYRTAAFAAFQNNVRETNNPKKEP